MTEDDLLATLAALAGEGRVPVEDAGHPDDPRLHVETPVGVIRTERTPDSVDREGSARKRRWTWGPYQLEEETDTQPGADAPHAVVVRRMDGNPSKRTSILAYEDEVATLNEAKRQLAAELGEDLALHEALVLLAAAYLDGGLDVRAGEQDS